MSCLPSVRQSQGHWQRDESGVFHEERERERVQRGRLYKVMTLSLDLFTQFGGRGSGERDNPRHNRRGSLAKQLCQLQNGGALAGTGSREYPAVPIWRVGQDTVEFGWGHLADSTGSTRYAATASACRDCAAADARMEITQPQAELSEQEWKLVRQGIERIEAAGRGPDVSDLAQIVADNP